MINKNTMIKLKDITTQEIDFYGQNGTLEDYPIGLFDLLTDLRLKLI